MQMDRSKTTSEMSEKGDANAARIDMFAFHVEIAAFNDVSFFYSKKNCN